MANISIRKFRGLYTFPNPLSQVPEGALSKAEDAVQDEEGIIRNRRGFNFYGSNTFASPVSHFLQYKERILALHGTTLSYDSNGSGSFTDYSGSYTSPTSASKIRGVEQNGSLFFTTNNGIKKLDALASTPAQAGIPMGLDMELTFSSNAAGWMPYNSRAAYRMLWGKKDANNVTTQGAPSSRAEISNLTQVIASISYSSPTATVTTLAPHGFSAGDVVDILNTEAFLSVTSLTYATGVVTATVASTAALATGNTITIKGANQPEYNGDFVITVASGTTFTYSPQAAPVAATATGTIYYGRDTDAFNGTYTIITAPTSTTFTYTVDLSPLGNPSAVSGKNMEVGKIKDVSISFVVPSGLTSSHFYQIYRSDATSDIDTTPSDNMQLVYESNYDGSSTSITVTDITPDDLKVEPLYTSPNQEGIGQANNEPPLALDLEIFKNFMFYANTTTKHFTTLQLLTTEGITRDTDTLTVANSDSTSPVTYTFSSAEDVANKKFRLYADITGTVSRSSTTATFTTSGSVKHGLTAGDKVFLTEFDDPRYNDTFVVTAVPSDTTFQFIVTTAFAASDSGTMSTGSPAQNIADTIKSFVRVVNKSSSSAVYAYYLSGPDDVPGEFKLERRSFTAAQFKVTATAAIRSKFGPNIASTGNLSENESVGNRLYYSKRDQPDSVPLLNYLNVGQRDQAIQRIVALRDSLFILKENGVYRLTGEDPSSFVVNIFDSNVDCLSADSVARTNNTIYMYSDQGIAAISDGGAQIVSRPIETDVLTLRTLTNFDQYMFGVGYESERKYILFSQSSSSDTFPTQAYVYNVFTDSWTKWVKPAYAALVVNDYLYFANTNTNTVLKERKDRQRTDKKDESVPSLITAVSGRNLTISYSYGTNDLKAGQFLDQSGTRAKIVSVSGAVATIDRDADFIVGSVDISNPINFSIKLQPQTASDPALLKQFREVQMYPKEDGFSFATMIFSSDLSNVDETVPFDFTGRAQGWGYFPWGTVPWGDTGARTGTTPLRTYVPRSFQRVRALTVGLDHAVANEDIALLNVGYEVRANKERTTR